MLSGTKCTCTTKGLAEVFVCRRGSFVCVSLSLTQPSVVCISFTFGLFWDNWTDRPYIHLLNTREFVAVVAASRRFGTCCRRRRREFNFLGANAQGAVGGGGAIVTVVVVVLHLAGNLSLCASSSSSGQRKTTKIVRVCPSEFTAPAAAGCKSVRRRRRRRAPTKPNHPGGTNIHHQNVLLPRGTGDRLDVGGRSGYECVRHFKDPLALSGIIQKTGVPGDDIKKVGRAANKTSTTSELRQSGRDSVCSRYTAALQFHQLHDAMCNKWCTQQIEDD